MAFRLFKSRGLATEADYPSTSGNGRGGTCKSAPSESMWEYLCLQLTLSDRVSIATLFHINLTLETIVKL